MLLPDIGAIKVMANQNSIVMEKLVKEGQLVKAGDVLYVLRSERQGQNLSPGLAPVDAQKAVSGILQKRRDSFGLELKQSSTQEQQRLADL